MYAIEPEVLVPNDGLRRQPISYPKALHAKIVQRLEQIRPKHMIGISGFFEAGVLELLSKSDTEILRILDKQGIRFRRRPTVKVKRPRHLHSVDSDSDA